jgi:hypothetical protein
VQPRAPLEAHANYLHPRRLTCRWFAGAVTLPRQNGVEIPGRPEDLDHLTAVSSTMNRLIPVEPAHALMTDPDDIDQGSGPLTVSEFLDGPALVQQLRRDSIHVFLPLFMPVQSQCPRDGASQSLGRPEIWIEDLVDRE